MTIALRQSLAESDMRLITEARTQAIFHRIQGMQKGGGRVYVMIHARWSGELSWARNRVSLASDRRDINVSIRRQTDRGLGGVSINQVDDVSLEDAVRAAERNVKGGSALGPPPADGLPSKYPMLSFPETHIWSDATFNVTQEQRSAIARVLSDGAEAKGMLSAGFLQMRVGEIYHMGVEDIADSSIVDTGEGEPPVGNGAERTARHSGYVRHTEAQCSMTVRHPSGLGSGWAGLSGYDWSKIDGNKLAQIALDKCLQSLNPVAIEPGRYTVILEPQAVLALVDGLIGNLQNREAQEDPLRQGSFFLGIDPSLGIGRTKLGLKVIDERITIRHDPMHPFLGVLPEPGLEKVTWIQHGVLSAMGYNSRGKEREYALTKLNENVPKLSRYSFEMTGGITTIEEMIATTKRGVLVTRVYGVSDLNRMSLLRTGVTRDGLWLIENGAISKSIKNMRWTESPLFVLNQIEQLGVPVPVFQPASDDLRPALVPTIKANDFAFTSTIDAV